ncbi:MAG: arsenate reductase ArsC [Bacillota bacterium]
MDNKGKCHVLFLCTGNSVRSQMAEGFLKVLGGDQFMVQSAGTHPAGVNPRSVAVMEEEGIDISRQSSDHLTTDMLDWADLLITLCGDAHENCPVVPHGVEKRHWPLSDPSTGGGTEEEIMQRFRETRDLIKGHVEELVAE